MKKSNPAAPLSQAKAADATQDLRSALKAANPALTDEAIAALVAQATGAGASRVAASSSSAKTLTSPKFAEAPRYRLLEKAFFPSVKVKQEDEWVVMNDVVLDPEEQPFVQQLSGAFGGRGTPKRHPLEIQYDGIPDDHMDPLNEAAEWMMDHIDEMKAHYAAQRKTRRSRRREPVEALPLNV